MESAPSFQFAKEAEPVSLNSSYILPEQARPHLSQVSSSSIPIIDLLSYTDQSESDLVQAISRACEDYGFFQIINHGVPEELSNSVMSSVSEFFQLPHKTRAELPVNDFSEEVLVSNPSLKVDGQDDRVNMWSESLFHAWDPADDAKLSPILHKYAPNYCEVIGDYSRQIDALVKRLLSLMSLGLGLEKDCLEEKIGDKYVLRPHSNYYPPCPDPELTMGLAVHTDIAAITVLRQQEHVTGLQVLKDEKWVSVDPLPNAFVVNVGDQIQVLSNGRYKSVHHRAVTNRGASRLSIAMFYMPDEGQAIEPIQNLIDDRNPQLYRKYQFSEFAGEFYKQISTRWRVIEAFALQPPRSTDVV